MLIQVKKLLCTKVEVILHILEEKYMQQWLRTRHIVLATPAHYQQLRVHVYGQMLKDVVYLTANYCIPEA